MLFADLKDEREPRVLTIEGTFPPWLRGTYVRNGPARFDFPGAGSVAHWFDGMSYLQRFTFSDGAIEFASRFTQSRAYQAALEGRRPFDEFGTAAQLSLARTIGRPFSATSTDNPNVNIARYGDSYVALTEVGLPRCFDPHMLETLAPFAFSDDVGTGYTTAHPAFVRGNWINYTLKFGRESRYFVWSMDRTGARTVLAQIASSRPSYIHSIGVSERYAILIEYPFTVNPLAIAFGGKAFIDNFSWDATAPARFHVVDLEGNQAVRTCEGEAFFSFHHVYAFDDGADVVVDVIGYDDASIVEDLHIQSLRANATVAAPGMGLRRYRLSLSTGSAERETIALSSRIELPRINTRAGARAHLYYAPRFEDSGFKSDALVCIDVENATTKRWSRPSEAPAEAIFVPRPGATGEDDGVVVSVVWSSQRNASALIVLDGRSFEECARAWTDVPLPPGFHGQFFMSG